MELFPTTLRRLLKTAGVTQLQFARRTSVAPGLISDLITGRRKPPLSKVEVFADALHLNGIDREQFFDVAALTHCPERIQRLIVNKFPKFPME